MREIRWTESAEDHIAAHAVSPDEVEQVVNTRPRLVLAGRDSTEYVFGTTDDGRHLLVVLAEAIDGRDYVVTAREMTDAERQAFRRKRR
ncbi:MAG: BrnT family toxin [Acidimicrobiales bacterium]